MPFGCSQDRVMRTSPGCSGRRPPATASRGRWGAMTLALVSFWMMVSADHASAQASGLPPAGQGPSSRQQVVLLHGLARSAASMEPMARALDAVGYDTCVIGYPSRRYRIGELAERYVLPEIARCRSGREHPVHVVTHSMGGILVRQLIVSGDLDQVGRVVMLAPPNAGSEVVDRLGGWRLFQLLNGPAGSELGTWEDSLPNRLGPAAFELGVIAGRRSVNPLLSLLIPGEDDGKVSVSNAALQGMRDFLIVDSAHPFVMRNHDVQQQTIHFLAVGRFSR